MNQKYFANLFLVIVIICFLGQMSNPTQASANILWQKSDDGINTSAMIYTMATGTDGKIYAGTTGDGLFASQDNGQTWQGNIITNSSKNDMVFSIFSHANGNIYVGENNGIIFNSTDNGISWSVFNEFISSNPTPKTICSDIDGNIYILYQSGEINVLNQEGTVIKSITDTPFNSLTWNMAIDSEKNIYVSTMGSGIFKSTDIGDTWTAINNGLPDLDVHKIKILTNGVLLAGLSGVGGVYRSTDGGTSWIESKTGMGDLIVMDILIYKENIIFAATTQDVFKSTDNGLNWTSIKENLPSNISIKCLNIDKSKYLYLATSTGQIYRTSTPVETNDTDLSMIVLPGETQTAYPGTSVDYSINVYDYQNQLVADAEVTIEDEIINEVKKYTTNVNGNLIYTVSVPEGAEFKTYSIKFSAAKEGYSNSAIVIRKVSVEKEDAWSKVQGYGNSSRILSIITSGMNNILLGTAGSSLYSSSDGGNTFISVSNGIETFNSVYRMEKTSNGTIYAATDWSGLIRTSDFGNSWEIISTGLDMISNVAIGANNEIFAGNQSTIRLSNDNGVTWNDLQNAPAEMTGIIDFTVCNNYLYIATGLTGLFVCNTENWNWTKVEGNLTDKNIVSVNCDNESNIYVGTYGNGVFFKANDSPEWIERNTDISDHQVEKIFTYNNLVFVLSFGKGVWLSSNQGLNWKSFNEGLENLNFLGLYSIAASENGYLYAGAFDRKLYKRRIPNSDQTITLISPPNNTELTENSVVFLWNKYTANVLNYCIEIRDSDGNISIDSTITDTTFTLFTLIPDKEYFWKVKAKTESVWSNWSQTWTFKSKKGSGIGDLDLSENDFSLSPNPAADFIEISLNESKNTFIPGISIFNSLAECVLVKQNTSAFSKQRINISSLATGLYYIKIGNFVKRFIVVR